jgi:hypothetical protein
MDVVNLPLTGAGVVDLVITDLGVFSIDKKGGSGMTLIELADGVTVDEIEAKTQADFRVALNGKQSDPIESGEMQRILNKECSGAVSCFGGTCQAIGQNRRL